MTFEIMLSTIDELKLSYNFLQEFPFQFLIFMPQQKIEKKILWV